MPVAWKGRIKQLCRVLFQFAHLCIHTSQPYANIIKYYLYTSDEMQKYVELDQVHRMNGTFSATRTRSTLLELEQIERRQLDFGRLQGEIRQYTLATPRELGWGKLLYFTQDVPLMAKRLTGSCMSIDLMTTLLK